MTPEDKAFIEKCKLVLGASCVEITPSTVLVYKKELIGKKVELLRVTREIHRIIEESLELEIQELIYDYRN